MVMTSRGLLIEAGGSKSRIAEDIPSNVKTYARQQKKSKHDPK